MKMFLILSIQKMHNQCHSKTLKVGLNLHEWNWGMVISYSKIGATVSWEKNNGESN